MRGAIYYGAMYGGTITSVLINVPGEAASVVTCFDGYQMAKQGRGGTALGIAAIGSFVGGIAATVALIVVAPPLARIALSFGPPEFVCADGCGLVSHYRARRTVAIDRSRHGRARATDRDGGHRPRARSAALHLWHP